MPNGPDTVCTSCGLCEGVKTVCVLGQGPAPCEVMIIGEAPGETEDEIGLPFVGREGAFLNECLRYAGVKRSDVYVTNAVHCRPPNNRTPTVKELKACSQWLDEEIAAVEPKFVLLLGAMAMKAALGLTGLDKHRGHEVHRDGRVYKITYHPAYGLRNPKAQDVIKEDVRQFFKLVRGELADEVTYTQVTPENKSAFNFWLAHQTEVSWDIETTGLDPFSGETRIVSLGFSNGKEQWVIVLDHSDYKLHPIQQASLVNAVAVVLKGKRIITHNGKFDSVFTAAKFRHTIYPTADTMLLYHLVDENASLELKNILSREFPSFKDYNVPLGVKHGGGSLEEHCTYLAKDVYYTYHLWQHAKATAEPRVLKIHDELAVPLQRVYIDAEVHGVYLDPQAVDDAWDQWTCARQAAEEALGEYADVNWGSSQQVAKVLFEDLKLPPAYYTPKGKPSTNEATLVELADKHPLPELILASREVKKNLEFLTSWKEKVDANGYIHPTFKITGTVTGRASSENPNFQQVPREKTLRRCFSAPPGYDLVEIDYSQVELRLVADHAQEPTMTRIYKAGGDIHSATVRDIFGIEQPDKEQRNKGKVINFGFIYGMKEAHFVEFAKTQYGASFTLEEATSIRSGYFKTYKLLPWHTRQRGVARALGYVSTWTGRRRHLPAATRPDYDSEVGEALRQAINSPIQGGAAELAQAASIEIRETYPEVKIVANVHDALLMYIHKDKTRALLPKIKAIMEHPKLLDKFGKKFSVPITVDIKIGPWGSGVEMKI